MFSRRNSISAGIAVLVVLFSLFFVRSRAAETWRGYAVSGFFHVSSAAWNGASGLRSFLGGGTRRDLGELRQERDRLAGEVAGLQAAAEENTTLRQALALREAGAGKALPASVIGFSKDGRDEFLMLGRGAADGVRVGDIVVNTDRVYGGTVVSVGADFSQVLLLTSGSQTSEVVLPRMNLRAVVRGNNSRELLLDLVPQDSDIQVGDQILAVPRATGGNGNLLIGEVRAVGQAEREVFKTVRAVHFFDPADDAVIILPALLTHAP